MYFDIEGYRPDTPTIESAISRREGLMLSVILHVVVVLAIAAAPHLPFVQEAAEQRAQRLAELEQQAALEAGEREEPRFVFVAPETDIESPVAPERGFLSDIDRLAQTPFEAEAPANPLPFAMGSVPDATEAEAPDPDPQPAERQPERAVARGSGPEPEPVEGPSGAEQTVASGDPAIVEDGQWAAALQPPQLPSGAEGQARLPGGSLGEALRNLERYIPQESLANPEGSSGQFGPWIDFDTKGVEFGPWIRRFIAQIRRNWFIPMAAMSLRGHVVVTFNVHKDGRITDLAVAKPSQVEAFNHSSFNALAASNPTQPLPPEYPADKAAFTVTFFYNESPAP